MKKKILSDLKKAGSVPLFKKVVVIGAFAAAAAAAAAAVTAVTLVKKNRAALAGKDTKNLARARNIYISGNTLASYAAAAYLIKDGGYSGKSIHIYGVPAAAVTAEEYGSIGGLTRALLKDIDARTDDDLSVVSMLDNIGYSAAPEVNIITEDGVVRSISLKPDKALAKEMAKAMKRAAQSGDLSGISVEECFRDAEGFFDSDLFSFMEMTFGITHKSRVSELFARLEQLAAAPGKAGLYDTLYYDFSVFSALEEYLESNGADIIRSAEISGVDAADNKVSAVHIINEGTRMTIYLNREDFVIIDTGSIGDGASEGSFSETAPKTDSAPQSMSLWQDAAAKDDSFGLPDILLEDVPEYMEFSIVDEDGYLLDKICEKTGIEPENGVSLLLAASPWRMKLTSEPYTTVPDAAVSAALDTTADAGEEDITDEDIAAAESAPRPVITVKGARIDADGSFTDKTMRECTGIELLFELCSQLGMAEDWDEIISRINTVMINVLPYRNAPLHTAPSYALPELSPCDNCVMAGDFVRTCAPSATIEQQIESARNAAYAVLGRKVKPKKQRPIELKKLI